MKNSKYIVLLVASALIFYTFHLLTWSIFKNIFSSLFSTFFVQLFLYILLLIYYLKKDLFKILFLITPLILGSTLYFITVISFTERSLTVDMITTLDSNVEMSLDEFSSAIDFESYLTKRISEQEITGIVKKESENYSLSNRGKFVSKIYKFFIKFYN